MISNDKKSAIQYKDLGFKELTKILKGMVNFPKAKLGVLGDKNSRESENGNNTNAEIGMRHEFGEGQEKRSFLRMPIINKFDEEVNKIDALNENALKQILIDKDRTTLVRKLGILGESIVLDAFNTGGFGEWKPSNMKRKKNHQTLVETTQLRDSVTSEVVSDNK